MQKKVCFPLTSNLKDLLLYQGLVTKDQLRVAEEEQKRQPRLLGQVLVDLNFIDPIELQRILSQSTGIPFQDLTNIDLESESLFLLPLEVCKRHQAIIFKSEQDHQILSIAMADPENVLDIDTLKKYLHQKLGSQPKIILFHTDPQQIQAVLHQNFSSLHASSSRQGAIARVESILNQAVQTGASDIHFQPEEQSITVRFRIDGLLRTIETFHKQDWSAVAVRLKIMAGLDIAESRRPQTGRFDLRMAGHQVDFRVSTHPTVFGENIVIRLLDKSKNLLNLTDLGFEADQIQYLKNIASLSQGLILISGPRGSGKTTTLYALFAEMDSQHRNIMTLEEPVEYQIPGIRQTEIHEGGVITFADGGRSILRQDPDVIFIGEIRDEATAKMALRSAMTGHLVIATVHSFDCYGVAARLIDLGLHPSLLSGHILCAISQRLVRKICTLCQQQGCPVCSYTGYKGRCALVQILPFDSTLHRLINEGASRSLIQQYCHNNHFPDLWHDGQKKLKAGITSLSELKRVVGEHETYLAPLPQL